MKKNKFIYLLLLPALLSAVACNKLEDFGDVNVNPGGTTKPIVSALFSSAMLTLGGLATQTRPGYYAQYFSETQYTDASLYSTPQIDFVGNYSGVLYDLENIQKENQSNNLNQAARIIKCYIYWNMTDRWGDLPYSEALKGVSFPTPKYDSQADVYKGMLAELKDAISKFDATSLIQGDISNYKGDVPSWKKLGNSLRLMIALQMSKKYPAASGLAATEFKAALADAGGVITSNDQAFKFDFPGGNLSSPWYNLYNGRKDVAESVTMTTLMGSLGDKRQNAFGSDVDGNPTTIGMPYGLSRAKAEKFTTDNPKWAYVLNASLRGQSGSVVIIPASIIALSRAEAADRGWTTEDVKTMYETGIALSFAQWNIVAPDAAYLNQSAVALAGAVGSGANIKQIAIQQYVACYPDGLRGWNIYRRTGFPELSPAPEAVNDSKLIPRRYTYGSLEYSSNPKSVAAAVVALPGGDKQDSKVWWDQ